jgi:integrase
MPRNDTLTVLMKSARLQAAEGEKAFRHGYGNGKLFCSVRIAFVPAVRQAGIQHVTFYNLHHTLTSRPAMAKVDLPAGQALLGHEVSSEYFG